MLKEKLLLLPNKPGCYLMKDKKWREIGRYLFLGILTALPYFIRNVLLSGWLVYPFTQIDIFNVAMERYLNRDFVNAGKLFMQANTINDGDPTSLVFAERCKNFIENGIPENWDGVINMTSK